MLAPTEIEMEPPRPFIDEFDEIPFDHQVKVVTSTNYGVTLKYLNKPFGFSFTDKNGDTNPSSIGAYVSGYSKKLGHHKDMANILPLGWHLTTFNGKDVTEVKTDDLRVMLGDAPVPSELHFQRKKLFPDDALGPVYRSDDTVVIEFRFKPFGFAIVDDQGGEDGFGAKVKLQKNGAHMNPQLDPSVLPENSYIMNINGVNVMRLNFRNIGAMLRTAKVPCRIRFGYAKKRWMYHYDCDSAADTPLKFLQREELIVPPDSNSALSGYDGITMNFKTLPLGLRLESCKTATKEQYCAMLRKLDMYIPEDLPDVVEYGAEIIGHDNVDLRDILPIGSQILGIEDEKVTLTPTKDIISMIKAADGSSLCLAFNRKVDDLARPLVMSNEDNRTLLQFRKRPFGFKIVDIKGGDTSYGARVKELSNRHLKKLLSEWAKIIDVNGRRCTGLDFKAICELIEHANMPAEILFENDDEYNPNAIEFDPETMPMDVQKADGVLVEFVRMPFGHITTMTMKDREAAAELENMEKDDEIEEIKYPKDALVLPSNTGFKGRVVDFLKRPFGFEIGSIKKVPEKKISKDDYVKSLEDRIAKLERLIASGGRKSVTIVDEEAEDNTSKSKTEINKPLPTGYGAVITKIRNDFLTNEIDEMGQILEEGWHLAYVEGTDVRFADTRHVAEVLAKAELPVRLSFVRKESDLYPPKEVEKKELPFKVIGALRDMSGAKGVTIQFNERPLGFSIVDEYGGYRHTGAAVRVTQKPELKKVLPRFARIISINDEDVKYANYASICEKLKKGKMPMNVSFVFFHTAEIKNYTFANGEVTEQPSKYISTFSKCEAMNITFEPKDDQLDFGMKIWAQDPEDREFGHGAQLINVNDEESALNTILKKGSKLVSVGHHHVSQMKHNEILSLIQSVKQEANPCTLGFTYDPLEDNPELNEAFTDSNITKVKSGGGRMIVKVNSAPVGVVVVDRDGGVKGIGAKVKSYENPLVKNIIPLGSTLISLNGKDVENMDHKHIVNSISTADFPAYLLFTMNQTVKTKYGFGLIKNIRDDGFRVVDLEMGSTAYLRPEEVFELDEEDEDKLYAAEAEQMADIARPDFLRMSTQSNLMDMVKRRESQMTSNKFKELNERLAAAAGTPGVLQLEEEHFDEFDEDYEPPSDSEEKKPAQSSVHRVSVKARLTASGVTNLLKDEETEDAEEVTAVGQGREDWVRGSKLEVHSVRADIWTVGTITKIDFDEDGEWLTVLYELPTPDGSTLRRTKETQRFFNDVRPLRVDTGAVATPKPAVVDTKPTPTPAPTPAVQDMKLAVKIPEPAEPSTVTDATDLSMTEMEAQLAAIEAEFPLTGGGSQIDLSPRSTQVGI